MGRTEKLHLAVSLDVEEEGLFCGRYARRQPQVQNVGALKRLVPLLERGIKPTLFCAHSVLANISALKVIDGLRAKYPMETGAHLHHWNTPPLEDLPGNPQHVGSVPAGAVADNLMRQKLACLFDLANAYNGSPVTSFRMGRWDLHRNIWPLLLEAGVQCDASVRPYHCGHGVSAGPDHFEAFTSPYWVKWQGGQIFEVPLTVTPLSRFVPMPENGGQLSQLYRSSLRHWGCLTLLPIEHPLWLMKLTTLLHVRHGGNTISLTWHSSEMMPGAVPHMPDESHVSRFLTKMQAYIDWLEKRFVICHETMNGIKSRLAPTAPVCENCAGDWNFA